jgi:hypothetical protein
MEGRKIAEMESLLLDELRQEYLRQEYLTKFHSACSNKNNPFQILDWTVNLMNYSQTKVDTQMQISTPSTKCTHGSASEMHREFLEKFHRKCLRRGSRGCYSNLHICDEFVAAYADAFQAAGDDFDSFGPAFDGTADEYPEIWYDAFNVEFVASIFLSRGVQYLLSGNVIAAQCNAVFAYYFEQYIETTLHKTRAVIDFLTMYELRQADQRTLVRFFKKRIPCYCLKKKYKEVKSVTKMSICMNSDCSHNAATVGARFGARVERSKTLRCTRCEQAFYCSRACQKAHWFAHREDCDDIAEKKAAFAAKRDVPQSESKCDCEECQKQCLRTERRYHLQSLFNSEFCVTIE